MPIWQKTEEELDAMGLPPPYWAFAWAGGRSAGALYPRQYSHGRPATRVLDLASGSGLVAIAAAKAGAIVAAADIDAFTESAISVTIKAEATSTPMFLVRDMLDDLAPVAAAL